MPGHPHPRARPTTGSTEQAWTLLRRFVEAHNRHAELAEELGFRLGAGRGKILFQLRDRPRTLRELAQANGMDAPYTTVIVDKLEAHGLVERGPHPHDKRRKLVSLTAAGRRAIDAAEAIMDRPPEAMETLSNADLDRLITIVGRLLAADQAGADAAGPILGP